MSKDPAAPRKGRFQKGVSGNPSGRPKKESLEESARKMGHKALDVMREIMLDATATKAQRLAAAIAIKEIGYGKAAQAVHHSGKIDNGLAEQLDDAIRRVKEYKESRGLNFRPEAATDPEGTGGLH